MARYGLTDVDVVRRLQAAIERLASRAPGEREALLALAQAILTDARTQAAAFDLTDLDAPAGSNGRWPRA